MEGYMLNEKLAYSSSCVSLSIKSEDGSITECGPGHFTLTSLRLHFKSDTCTFEEPLENAGVIGTSQSLTPSPSVLCQFPSSSYTWILSFLTPHDSSSLFSTLTSLLDSLDS